MPTTIYHRNFERLLTILPDLPEMQPGDYRKLTAPGFMDLSVDVLLREDDRLRIALAHNYEMNGDLVPDPDMELRVDLPGRTVEALTYQDFHGYNVAYPKPGQADPTTKAALNSFLETWLANLMEQGHTVTESK